MQIKLKFLNPFKELIGKTELILKVERSSVKSLLDKLVKDYPKLRDRIFDKTGKVDYNLNLMLNGKLLFSDKDLAKMLKEGDELLFMFPVSGG